MTRSSRFALLAAVLLVAPAALEAQKAARPLDTRNAMTPDVTSGFSSNKNNPEIKPVSIGTRHSSSLDDADGALQSGHRVELWAMQLRANETVIVTVRSSAFDTRVAVFNPEDTSNSAENDDFEQGSTNSQVTFRANSDGVYGILVAAYDAGERGSYTLEVMRSGEEENTLAKLTRPAKETRTAKVAR